ncbi:MAG: endonuclease III [Candidatus Poseidoniaceae archaeon]|jgi:endonuclease-3|nr:endonuclease III [Candidatus Poseidoniaceae archaeon]
MKRSEKAERILDILEELYPETPIPLDHNTPYQLLIAVLMSAQTTDKKVNQVTPELFKLGATPEAMSMLDVKQIQSIIREIGLAPTKARNIHRLSEIIVEKHGGEVPHTFTELELLPGVGHKTASVVMAQAFGISAFPVDTHIHRLASRWGLSTGKTVERTEADLKFIFPKDKWNKLHLQIIFFGREFCPARNHDLSKCQICSWTATKKRIAEEAKKR